MKQISIRIVALLLSAVLLGASCAAAEVTGGKESVFTQSMIERSLLSVGNTQRLHKAIDKARNGETVTIAYLGGSITEGSLATPKTTRCYAYLSAQLFAEKFMPDAAQLKYVNAGISGTPSLLGITRLEQDVLRHQPDIVFVEFAVNDNGDLFSQGVYESLLRKLLTSESEPAVILIFTGLSGGNSCQAHMSMLGKYYDLGMISVKDAIWPEIQQGNMQWRDYSTDYAHPTNEGHAFIADAVGHYFDLAAAQQPQAYVMPANVRVGNYLEYLENIRSGDSRIVSEGAFPFAAVSCYSYRQGWWHRGMVDGTEPLTLQVEGTRMTIAFKQMNDQKWGSAEVWVDGERKLTLPGYASNAWGNVQTQLVSFGSDGAHTVEIRMAEGDEIKTFQLLDLAVAP